MIASLQVVTMYFLAIPWYLGMWGKQKVVSRSSTESEYLALALGAVEIFWIHSLLLELHIFLSVLL